MSPDKLTSPSAPRSARGLFSVADEDAVFRSVAEELRVRGPLALQELRDRYDARVDEPERRRAIEELVHRMEHSSPGDGRRHWLFLLSSFASLPINSHCQSSDSRSPRTTSLTS